jgi:serine/threonine-protein kinase
VRVVVSSGQSSFVVPSVVGETQENAINKIKSSRMEVGNITEFASDKPKGTVVTQSPDADKGFDKPQKVDLLISKGQ